MDLVLDLRGPVAGRERPVLIQPRRVGRPRVLEVGDGGGRILDGGRVIARRRRRLQAAEPVDRVQAGVGVGNGVGAGAGPARPEQHLVGGRRAIDVVKLARIKQHVLEVPGRLQHRDVDAGDLEFLVLLRVSGDLVLRERLAQADLVRAWVTPFTGDGERVVDTPEVPRFAHVVADDCVREDDVPRPLERAAELHLIGESRDPSPTARAEDARVAEALLQLRPAREDA